LVPASSLISVFCANELAQDALARARDAVVAVGSNSERPSPAVAAMEVGTSNGRPSPDDAAGPSTLLLPVGAGSGQSMAPVLVPAKGG
jgi:hypothetical protein